MIVKDKFPHDHSSNADGGQLDFTTAFDATTKTKFITISGCAFVSPAPETDDIDYDGSDATNSTGGDISLYASVTLPTGAIITACKVYGSSGGDDWYLYRRILNNTAAAELMGSDAINSTDSTISNGTISGSYRYWVQVDLSATRTVRGILITYTVTADNQG